MKKDTLIIAKHILKSRLIVGTEKYKKFQTAEAVKASGADMVTVAKKSKYFR